MGADRHRAQSVGEHEVESGRARHLDVEVVRRPIAGHLGVAVCHPALSRCGGDRSERVGARRLRETGGRRASIPRSATPSRPSSTIVHHCSTATAPSASTCSRCTTTWVPARDVRTAEIYDDVSSVSPGTSGRCNTMSCSPCTPPRTRCHAAAGTSALAASTAVKTRITGNTAERPVRPVPLRCRHRSPPHRRRCLRCQVAAEPAREGASDSLMPVALLREPVLSVVRMVTTFSDFEKTVLEGGALTCGSRSPIRCTAIRTTRSWSPGRASPRWRRRPKRPGFHGFGFTDHPAPIAAVAGVGRARRGGPVCGDGIRRGPNHDAAADPEHRGAAVPQPVRGGQVRRDAGPALRRPVHACGRRRLPEAGVRRAGCGLRRTRRSCSRKRWR